MRFSKSMRKLICGTGLWLFAGFVLPNTVKPAKAARSIENGVYNAYIPMNKLPIINYQQTVVWCWAASAQAIFRYYGYEVDQSVIVANATGIVTVTAANAPLVVNMLNRTYTAADGRRFSVRTPRVYDAFAWAAGDPGYWQRQGIAPLDNPRIIQELADEHPVFMGTTNHAMVLTSCQYHLVPPGLPLIVSGWVLDPAPVQLPSGQIVARGLRMLAAHELRATFGAEVQVTPL